MLPNKITKKFDNSASAIFTVLDMLKLSDKNLCFSTNYNAKYSQTVKFILILLMPFFRIRNVLNYCNSIFLQQNWLWQRYLVSFQKGQFYQHQAHQKKQVAHDHHHRRGFGLWKGYGNICHALVYRSVMALAKV